MSRRAPAWTTLIVGALITLGTSLPGGAQAAPGDLQAVDLTLLARHDLASPGRDGQTKARGQNGDLAVLGDIAFVAGGARFHGAQTTPGRVCTDYGGVKVVDVGNPSSPQLRSTIEIADAKTILSGPNGNPRRGQAVPNVSASVSAVSAIDNPVAGKKILAIATLRCEASFFNGARIEFWDVSSPSAPTRVGTFDPETIANPACNPACPPGQPANGAWGIFEDVRMFTRANGPGGSTRVYAVATTPFSIGNSGVASPQGDFRLLDVTDPAAVTQIDTFPKRSISSEPANGCRIFDAGRSAAPTPDGSHAILSWYDGALPRDTSLAGPNSAALFNLDLDNLPQVQGTSVPRDFAPSPPTWGFPLGSPGGMTPAGEVEGNAADVQPFLGPGGRLMTFMSEEDVDPALTTVTINAPGSSAYSGRGCELPFTTKLHQRAGQQLSGSVAYVGRGCPASRLAKSTLRAEDPYLQDPSGKIVVFEGGGDQFDGCSTLSKVNRVVAAGATGVLLNIGANVLNLSIPGPDGGIPAVPSVNIQLDAFNKMVGSYVPNRVLTGTAFPPTVSPIPNTFVPSYDRTLTAKTLTTTAPTPGAATTIAVEATTTALAAGTVLQFPPVSPSRVPAQVIVRLDTPAGATSVPVEVVAGTAATTFQPAGATGAVSNVSLARLANAVTAATNAAPIAITTATHGLRTGDRVSITDVGGNIAANGTATVTVTSSTTFTLNGTTGNGNYTSGGSVRLCRPSEPTCSATDSTRTDISRFRSEADAADRSARVRVIERFPVTVGQPYRAGALIEIASRVDGVFKAAVTWHAADGTELSRSEFASRSAVSARTLATGEVTAPAGAVTGAIAFEWTGAAAEGVAFVDGLSLTPANLAVTLKDNQGEWGAQRIIDFSQSPPTQAGLYRSPRSMLWPPPNDGIYSPRQARMASGDLALTTWMSDGLRVLDVKDPTAPREIGAFVPPDVNDPSPQAGAGPTNLRDTSNPNLLRAQSWPNRALVTGVGYIPRSGTSGTVVISDINAGLYVLRADIRREAPAEGGPPLPPPVLPVPNVVKKDTVKPRLSALSVTPAAFRARVSGSSITKVGGTRVRYRVSERATTTFTVQRVENGRRRGASCQRPSRANRRGRPCTRYVRLPGSFRHVGLPARLNALRFSGRLGGRKLPVARYRLRAQPRDAAGNRGQSKTAVFRIKR